MIKENLLFAIFCTIVVIVLTVLFNFYNHILPEMLSRNYFEILICFLGLILGTLINMLVHLMKSKSDK